MKPIFQIVLYFLISLGQARDLIFHDEGDPNSYPVIETLNASEMMNKLQMDDDMKASDVENRSGIEKERDAVKLSGFPYVGEDCCNLSTTPACLKIKGSCVPRNETCNGDVYYGNEYCVISNLKSCMCCVPPPVCKTLSPCEKLNGTCIGTNEPCDGRSVTGKEFCKKHKTCKCCFPTECQCQLTTTCTTTTTEQTTSTTEPTTSTTEPTPSTTEPTTSTTEPTTSTTEPTTSTTEPTTSTTEPTTSTTEPTTSTTWATTSTTEPTSTTWATTLGYCHTLRTTICPDGSRCHANATCVLTPSGYICRCNLGFAGDGLDCGEDSDIDSHPDLDLICCTVQDHCHADNCPSKPNSGQEDSDYDGIGDVCDFTVDPHTGPTEIPPTTFSSNGSCIPRKTNKCLSASNAWRTKDSDGDGHVDSCDNCPHVSNVNQVDTDYDNVGDDCDQDQDTDNDGIDDGVDNCIDVINPDQSDVDYDGDGDKCDDDADDDGIPNVSDNCWLVANPGQKDANNDGFGDACQDDKDGDCVPDTKDICPKSSVISGVDFSKFTYVIIGGSQPDPEFEIKNKGKEITQIINSKAGLMFGEHSFSGVDYDGTIYIGNDGDDDFAGFIFGYESSKSFYVVLWKKTNTGGVQVKRVHSSVTPSQNLADALCFPIMSSSYASEATLIWHDPQEIGWEYDTSYRWELIHRPQIGLIRVRFQTGSGIVVDSGNLYDDGIKGGRLGVFCYSQAFITWSSLEYSCNDDSVPQEVYDDLPSDKQAKITVDPFKSWAETPKPTEGPQPTTAKPKPQECQKLGGRCMSKRNEKKCKGKIDKMGTCKLKNYGCCIPKCSMTLTMEDGTSANWTSPNYDGTTHYPEGDYCCWLNITIPAKYSMFIVTMQMFGKAVIHDTTGCSGDAITYYDSKGSPGITICGLLTGQQWTEMAIFNTPRRFSFEWCSMRNDGGTDIGFNMAIEGHDISA